MHRVLLHTVVFDFAPDVHDAGRDFWRVALQADVRRGTQYPEYHVLQHPAALSAVLIQRLNDGPSRIHLDIEADDPSAEVARLVAAGAKVLERHADWTVLADPAGIVFCVVPAESPEFADHARTIK